MYLNNSGKCRLLSLVMLFAIFSTFLFGCVQLTGYNSESDLKTATEFYTIQINGLCSYIKANIPEEYYSDMPEVYSSVVSDSSVLIMIDTDIFADASDEAEVMAAAEKAKVSILASVACNLIDYLSETALSMADEESAVSVNETAAAIKAEITQAEDMSALYQSVLSAEDRIFSCISPNITDTSAEPQIVPVLYRDSEQQLWLRILSNISFPGLADSTTGFSLQLLLENGDTMYASADSISNYDSIVYDGAYSIRFNLNELITEIAEEEYFSGRNRVVFSMFTLDNTYGFTHDFYRMSLSDITTVNGSEAYLMLLQIIAAYTD